MGTMALFEKQALAEYCAIELAEANDFLIAHQHKMGAINRPMGLQLPHGLYASGRLVGVTVTADLAAKKVAGFERHQAIELARVCASEPWVNRLLVRLWRETVLPEMRKNRGADLIGLSYQDAVLHSGNLYRFDGWTSIATSRSGTDRRSGLKCLTAPVKTSSGENCNQVNKFSFKRNTLLPSATNSWG